MKFTTLTPALTGILCFCFLLSKAQTVHPEYLDGEIYVQTANLPLLGENRTQIDLKDIPFLSDETIAEFGINSLQKPFWRTSSFELQTTYRIGFTEQTKVNELIRLLKNGKNVNYAEQIPLHKKSITPNDLGPSTTSGGGQWHLWKIAAQQAWDVSLGNANITIAIVDDAVKINHPDLSPSIWINPGEIADNGIDDDGNGYVDDINGYDVASEDNNPMPWGTSAAHGTHVAGIAGAATNNGIGISSIGSGLKIIAVKSTYSSSSITHGFEGITYAADAGADVINMSWGGSLNSATGLNVVNYAITKGCILVAAAGNQSSTARQYPAAYPGVISVASTTNTDAKSSFSSYGTWVDISAPGSAIYSTYFSSLTTNTYYYDNGTSMASPLVAGLCGLMLSHNPYLTPAQVEQCLYSTADPVTTNITLMGAGRINALGAMQCSDNLLNSLPETVINAETTFTCPNNDVQFHGSSSAGSAISFEWIFVGGTPSTSNSVHPIVNYPTEGMYPVTLITTNGVGSDTLTINNFVNISNSAQQTIFSENFEGNISMFLQNPDDAETWSIYTAAGNAPGTKSCVMPFYSYATVGQRDGLITPVLSFAMNDNVQLSFKHAYAMYTGTASDSLIVKISTNGGSTWKRIWQRADNGTGNFSTKPALTGNFSPSSATDWCSGTYGASCFTIPLDQYSGMPNIRLMFEGYNNYGNNLYLDDILIKGTCASGTTPQASFATSGNMCEGGAVSFTNTSLFATSYEWTFPGGSPSTSTATSPSPVYTTPGTYPVTLTVTGPGGTTSQTTNIIIKPKPEAAITVSGGIFSATLAGQSYQWYRNYTLIPGATNQTYIPTTNGTYFVRVISPNGCFNNSSNITIANASLEDVASNFDLYLFPNPAKDQLTITWNNNAQLKTNIRLLDAVGKEIQFISSNHENSLQLDVSQLAGGIYYAGITFGDYPEIIRKFVIVE